MKMVKPNEQRAKNAIILIWVVLALHLVNFISAYMQYNLLQTVANGGSVSYEAAAANDIRQQICNSIYRIAFLISGITFIMWFRRAYFNLQQKVGYRLTHSDGWAVACWFIPVICWFRPHKIMREIYVDTKEFFTKKGLSEKVNYSTNYLGWWWALFIILQLVGIFVVHRTSDGTYLLHVDNIITITVVQMISNVLWVLLALITIKVIKDYSQVEPLLAQISDEETKTEE